MPGQQEKRSLVKLISADQVLTSPAQLAAYMLDAGMETGLPDTVILVKNTTDIQSAVGWASEHKMALTARGAGTGYTGGSVAALGGVMVSFSRMNAILEVDETSRIAIVEPGVSNEALQRRLQPLSLFYPPDPASQSVCTLGGNIAENAGGPHCLKYGVTSNYVLGLEVILPDGQVVQLGGRTLDPPEYDFTGLLTGSEGTLAMISKAILRLRRPFEGVQALTASFDSVAQAGEAVSAVIAASLLPATIELMDGGMISIVEDYLAAGLPTDAEAMLIIDVDGYESSLEEQLDEISTILMRFQPLEIKLAHTPAERELIWKARRSAGGAVARISPNEYLVDVAVPRSQLAQALQSIQEIGRQSGFRVCFLAHAGDGNLHPNLLCDFSIPGEQERVLRAGGEVLELCARLGGSIGGEHGIGLEKRSYLPSMYSPGEINAMLEVKELFDPEGLMNPGKIFPPEFVMSRTPSISSTHIPYASYEPANASEAAEALRSLQHAGQPTYLCGGGTHWRGDTPPGTLLSSAGLRGILQLSTTDMYVSARAGTPVVDLQRCVSEKGFWIPLTAPWRVGTIGGAIAANANSPLRSLFGGLRDQVLQIQVALADGRLLCFGRSLVKDVAGYQMSKLFVGSYGTLGMITEVTLKLQPKPRRRLSLLVQAPDLKAGLTWAYAALRSAVICSGLVLAPEKAGELPDAGYKLVFTAEGHPADVTAEIQAVRQTLHSAGAYSLVETDETSAAREWERIAASTGFVSRIGLPACDLNCLASSIELSQVGKSFAIDIANGTVLLAGEPSLAGEILLKMRRVAGPEGYAIMEAGPREFLRRTDAWGSPRSAHNLMRGLKLRWDPANVLNRNEFISLS